MRYFRFIFLLVSGLQLFSVSYAQIRIMPLGDSITRGVMNLSPAENDSGYRGFLYRLLEQEMGKASVNFVGSLSNGLIADADHEGHGGWRADQIDQNILEWINNSQPDYVLLHIGTNDVSNDQPHSSTVAEIESILDKIFNYNSDIVILLASIVPRNDSKDPLMDDLNTRIKALYYYKKESGYKIYYVGQDESFRENPNFAVDYFSDVVHPNIRGYRLMALNWYHALIEAIRNGIPRTYFVTKFLGDAQSGQANYLLLENISVKVLDSDSRPAQNIPVDFLVSSGDGTIQESVHPKHIFLEAEAAQISFPSQIFSDSNASNNAYVSSPERKDGRFTLTVNLEKEGNYQFWGRVFGPSGEEDSFYLLVDNRPDTILWDIGEKRNEWYWLPVKDRFTGLVTIFLSAGEHLLHFVTREANARLDKIAISTDVNYTPFGKAGFGAIVTDENGIASAGWLLGPSSGIQTVEVTSFFAPEQKITFHANVSSPASGNIRITGSIVYYNQLTPVPGIVVQVDSAASDTTDQNGVFSFNELEKGADFKIQPETNIPIPDAQNILSFYDAALIARGTLGLDPLTDHQLLAADVNGDNQASMYDAALLARFVIGLDGESSSFAGKMIFTPKEQVYTQLDTSVDNIQFIGIMRGDMHGGWNQRKLTKAKESFLTTAAENIVYSSGDTLLIEIPFQAGSPIYSFYTKLNYDPENLTWLPGDYGTSISRSFTIFENEQNGVLKLGGICPVGIQGSNKIRLRFLCSHQRLNSSKLVQVTIKLNNNTAQKTLISIDDEKMKTDEKFTVDSIYPNPFNLETKISFYLTKPGIVSLHLFNMLGQEVWSHEGSYQSRGEKTVLFNGKNMQGGVLGSGRYYLHIKSNTSKSTIVQKMLIMK